MSMEYVKELIEGAGYGNLATCEDGQPRVRPMAFVMVEGGRLWSSTHRSSGKVRELETNNAVEVVFTAPSRVQVRVEGVADLNGGDEKKRRLLELNPRVRNHFADENDSKYVHIEVIPTRIRWTEPGFGEYHEVELLD